MAIITIAGITLREASRRRLLVLVGALTAAVIPLVAWGFSRIPALGCHGQHACNPGEIRGVEAGLLILVAYMFSFIIAVATPFLAAPALATDVESHVILGILPRPLHRAEVVIGKWLGLGVIVVAYTALTCGLEFLAIRLTTGYVPPHPALTTVFIIGEAFVLLTLALLGSTRLAPITCGIVTVLLFGVGWMAGIAGAIGTAFGNAALTNIGTISSLILPTDGLWRGAVFNLEPVSFMAVASSTREASADPFAVASAPTSGYVIWSVLWIAAVLVLAIRSFATREV